MSLYDYQKSKEIALEYYPFNALIMAAMRQADTNNMALLNLVYPQIYQEFIERYNAPGGMIEGWWRKDE
jgi:hypothetical protein